MVFFQFYPDFIHFFSKIRIKSGQNLDKVSFLKIWIKSGLNLNKKDMDDTEAKICLKNFNSKIQRKQHFEFA